jgi:hypothetical protein
VWRASSRPCTGDGLAEATCSSRGMIGSTLSTAIPCPRGARQPLASRTYRQACVVSSAVAPPRLRRTFGDTPVAPMSPTFNIALLVVPGIDECIVYLRSGKSGRLETRRRSGSARLHSRTAALTSELGPEGPGLRAKRRWPAQHGRPTPTRPTRRACNVCRSAATDFAVIARSIRFLDQGWTRPFPEEMVHQSHWGQHRRLGRVACLGRGRSRSTGGSPQST